MKLCKLVPVIVILEGWIFLDRWKLQFIMKILQVLVNTAMATVNDISVYVMFYLNIVSLFMLKTLIYTKKTYFTLQCIVFVHLILLTSSVILFYI